MLCEKRQLAFQAGGFAPIVGVLPREELAARQRQPAIERRRESAMRFVQEPDAMVDALKAPVTAAAAALYADRLNWRPDGAPGPRYEVLNGAVFGSWNYNGGQSAAESVTPLHTALAFDPALRVTIMHGLYDLVTPYYASKLILDQLPPVLAGRTRLVAVPGGHMFYTRDASRVLFRNEGQALIAP